MTGIDDKSDNQHIGAEHRLYCAARQYRQTLDTVDHPAADRSGCRLLLLPSPRSGPGGQAGDEREQRRRGRAKGHDGSRSADRGNGHQGRHRRLPGCDRHGDSGLHRVHHRAGQRSADRGALQRGTIRAEGRCADRYRSAALPGTAAGRPKARWSATPMYWRRRRWTWSAIARRGRATGSTSNCWTTRKRSCLQDKGTVKNDQGTVDYDQVQVELLPHYRADHRAGGSSPGGPRQRGAGEQHQCAGGDHRDAADHRDLHHWPEDSLGAGAGADAAEHWLPVEAWDRHRDQQDRRRASC